MSTRTFQFRLHSRHVGPDFDVQSLQVERLSDEGEWQEQRPSFDIPPFRLHLIALLLCLHHHLMAGARERRIPFQQVHADMTVVVSGSWDLEEIRSSFAVILDPEAAGEATVRPDEAAIAAIRERMLHSPVPRNRPERVPLDLEVIVQG